MLLSPKIGRGSVLRSWRSGSPEAKSQSVNPALGRSAVWTLTAADSVGNSIETLGLVYIYIYHNIGYIYIMYFGVKLGVITCNLHAHTHICVYIYMYTYSPLYFHYIPHKIH